MYATNPLTMQCVYKTPCGWCVRQNKKCKIEEAKEQKRCSDLIKELKENKNE